MARVQRAVVDEHTKDRIAKNEVLFREVNERVQELERERQDDADPGLRWEFLCECGRATCAEPIRMTRAEYEQIRSNAVHFAVLPGHERPEVERIHHRTDRFFVIEKLPEEQDVARATDPRG
jgi:hypothetical protein